MCRQWDNLFGLNEERSIWIGPEELGTEKLITHHDRRYAVKIPAEIHREVTLRLRGLGKTRAGRSGDLLLRIALTQGEDLSTALWLSESSAEYGTEKLLALGERKIQVVIPPKSTPGLALRLKGLGQPADFSWQAPFTARKSGNLLVRLQVFPDTITPQYGSFEALATDAMVLEGWVYRRIDELVQKMGKTAFPGHPLRAETAADAYNEGGWRGVYRALASHLRLDRLDITPVDSDSATLPGSCQQTVKTRNNVPVSRSYNITIQSRFLDNPFTVAAILAHELCHVVAYQSLEAVPSPGGTRLKSKQETLDDERTVDLLVFMFRVGEFQLRVARDQRLTLGYFNQEIFERMHVIVSRKLDS